MRDIVNAKTSEKDKLEEWLNQLKESECKESPLKNAQFFSPTSVFGFVKLLMLLFSFSESSSRSANILKRVI